MNSWQLIFLQSKANNGAHDENGLPAQNWEWPQETWLQKRLVFLQETRRDDRIQRGRPPASFSLVPLLLVAGEIPADARQALMEGQRRDAATLLMREYDLSCNEAGDLLDVPAC